MMIITNYDKMLPLCVQRNHGSLKGHTVLRTNEGEERENLVIGTNSLGAF